VVLEELLIIYDVLGLAGLVMISLYGTRISWIAFITIKFSSLVAYSVQRAGKKYL
jgi:hypothetical protein